MAQQLARIRPEEVQQKLQQGAGTLLVCAYEEEDKGRAFRLKGAITLQELEERREGLPRDAELVFYCACPADELSTQRAREWQGKGFANAKVLAGGVERWKAAGYDMAQPSRREALDHTPEPAPLGPKPAVEDGEEPLPPRASEHEEQPSYGAVDDAGAGLSEADTRGAGDRMVGAGGPMKARDLMTRSPEVIQADRPVIEAARRMRDLDVGALPVCDEDRRLLGMITDRDITLRVTAEGKDPGSTSVGDAMSKELITCGEDDDVVHLARLMQERHVRRVPIVRKAEPGEAPGDIVGIVSLDDLATDLRVSDLVARTLARAAGTGAAG
ncbi:MAG: CBS domain-containing protein [Planctomycetes bacterium]|nr:CBS domain-containing protein [Planctomycetota bacterium]